MTDVGGVREGKRAVGQTMMGVRGRVPSQHAALPRAVMAHGQRSFHDWPEEQ